MEKLNEFNLELSLFLKTVHTYIENVNETDDETIKLLAQTILAVDKLQNGSKHRETSFSNENRFFNNLNDEQFICRRHIVCRLCHMDFPLSADDFKIHIQKKSHKEEEAKLKSMQVNSNGNGIIQATSSDTKNDTNISENGNVNRNTNGNGNIESRSSSSSNSTDNNNVSLDTKTIDRRIDANPFIAEVISLSTRTEDRIQSEQYILEIISRLLKTFDCNAMLTAFGSSTYGFGGSKTNFNILVRPGSEKSPLTLMAKFEKSFKSEDFPDEFEALDYMKGTRAQKRRFQLLHKESNILCCLHFDQDVQLAESSQIIRDCISQSPLCYHLIACVKSLQNTLNSQNASESVHFNTYITSIFVIFFLQVNYNFPKLKNLPSSQLTSIDIAPIINKDSFFKKAFKDFFHFYKKLEVERHLIDLNIGRWQERQLQNSQTIFSPEQKSLRDSIAANPENWKNCSMYVHDIKSPGINVTAEISREESLNFKVMCNVLASSKFEELRSQFIDEYTLRQQFPQSSNKCNGSSLSLNSSASNKTVIACSSQVSKAASGFSMQNMKMAICSIENDAKLSCLAPEESDPKPSLVKKLENLIKIEDVSKTAKIDMISLLSRSADRVMYEVKIMELLSFYFSAYDSTIKVVPFGSSTYGFGSMRTDFNLLIKIAPSKSPIELLQYFENSMNTSRLQRDFEVLDKTVANRVQKQQLRIVHKKTCIICVLLFDPSATLEKSSEIIRQFIALNPICKELIAYVKAIHNVLNDIAAKNGLPALKFNSYMISILVVFYLQMNHNFPEISELSKSSKITLPSKASLNELVREFFKFYGHTYDVKSQLISLNIGRWQTKLLPTLQTKFSPEQKSLRDGIASNPKNWKDCLMWVQDICAYGTNIMAEISNDEGNNFIKLCQMFSSYNPKSDQTPTNSATMPILNQGDEVFSMIDKKIADMRKESFMQSRGNVEKDIVCNLTKYINAFDASFGITKIGSSHYGIKGTKTDVNLLVNTRGEKPKGISQLFFFKLDKTDIGAHFKKIIKSAADRVLRRQIKMIHIKTGLQCTLLFERDNSIAESSEIIKRYIDNEPMCRFLITYIKTWQDVLNDLDVAKFNFNTYIISVLVIFFLQLNHKLPRIDEISTVQSNTNSNIDNFKNILRQFFDLYGNRYQIWNHVISAHIGQWQERRTQSEQVNYSEAKQRLRTGMETTPDNWNNCTMYVQDLIRPDVNITAEISKAAAENFQLMCQTFAKRSPHK